jgi:hypothetical protein
VRVLVRPPPRHRAGVDRVDGVVTWGKFHSNNLCDFKDACTVLSQNGWNRKVSARWRSIATTSHWRLAATFGKC